MSDDEQWRPMTPTERERNAVIIAEALQETFDRISEMEAKEKADKERIADLGAQVTRLQNAIRGCVNRMEPREARTAVEAHTKPGDLDPIGGES